MRDLRDTVLFAQVHERLGVPGFVQNRRLVYSSKASGAKLVVVTMCIGGGQGAAGLFELT